MQTSAEGAECTKAVGCWQVGIEVRIEGAEVAEGDFNVPTVENPFHQAVAGELIGRRSEKRCSEDTDCRVEMASSAAGARQQLRIHARRGANMVGDMQYGPMFRRAGSAPIVWAYLGEDFHRSGARSIEQLQYPRVHCSSLASAIFEWRRFVPAGARFS